MLYEVITKYFFDLNISNIGLQSGFNVHGNISNPVQSVIWVSEIPMFLYMIADAWAMNTNGKPIAK